MAYRQITMDIVRDVLRLWMSGSAIKLITRQFRLDRNTIRRYITVAQKCGVSADGELTTVNLLKVAAALGTGPGRSRGKEWEVCEKYREIMVPDEQGRIRLTDMHKMIQAEGNNLGYATLVRFAHSKIHYQRGRMPIRVPDCSSGKVLLVDIIHMGLW